MSFLSHFQGSHGRNWAPSIKEKVIDASLVEKCMKKNYLFRSKNDSFFFLGWKIMNLFGCFDFEPKKCFPLPTP